MTLSTVLHTRGLRVACLLVGSACVSACYANDIARIAEQIEANGNAFIGEHASFEVLIRKHATQNVQASRASGGLIPADWRIAKHGRNWYSERVFIQDGKQDAANVKTIVLNKGKVLEGKPGARYVSVTPFEQLPNLLGAMDNFFRFAGINAPAAIRRDSGSELSWSKFVALAPDELERPLLPDCLLERNTNYRIIKETGEQIVVANSWDEITLDASKNFAITHRKTRWGPDLPWRDEITNSDFREVKPGLWIPFKTEELIYAKYKAEDESIWNKVTAKCLYKLEELKFDGIDEGLFAPELPVGTRVVDTVSGIRYEVTKANNPFEDEITEGRRLLGTVKTPSKGKGWYLALCLGVCAASVATYIWWRKRQ